MRLLLLLTFLITFHAAQAQQRTVSLKTDSVKRQKSIVVLKLDSNRTILHKFDDETIQRYKEQKDFQYDDVAPKTTTFWDRFWAASWEWFNNLFRSSTKPGQNAMLAIVLKYVLMAVSVSLLTFVIFKLFGVDFKLFFGKSKAAEVPYDESLENIHEINFDEQLEAALQYHNYRLAVRLLYLKTLKLLSDKALIDWQSDKTNQVYVRELEGQLLHADFLELTYRFEYVWYGDFGIDQAGFLQVQQSFQQFNVAVI